MSRKAYIGVWVGAVIVAALLLMRFGNQLLNPFVQENIAPTRSPSDSSAPLVGNDAPYFELTDLLGNRVRLSDFAHTPLLVTFWSKGVSDAADQIKIFDDWQSSHPNALFKLLTINSQEEQSVVKSFITRGNYDVPVLLDKDGAAGKAYGILTLPTSFFIDEKGVIQEIYVGIMSQKMIGDKIEAIIR